MNPLCHPDVYQVFEVHAKHGGIFFGITGDIDNLGFFVARNGRAAGENLVDHFNLLLKLYIEEWQKTHEAEIHGMCFLPAGEEISILGVVRHRGIVDDLFRDITPSFNRLLKEHDHFLNSKETALTFGCAFIEEPATLADIADLVANVNRDEEYEPYPAYLEILTTIRKKLGLRLDLQKFRDIMDGDPRPAIVLRAYVYLKLLQYKTTTQAELPRLAGLIENLDDILPAPLSSDEGLNPEMEAVVTDLRNRLTMRTSNG